MAFFLEERVPLFDKPPLCAPYHTPKQKDAKVPAVRVVLTAGTNEEILLVNQE
jgi:hypothetical protein